MCVCVCVAEGGRVGARSVKRRSKRWEEGRESSPRTRADLDEDTLELLGQSGPAGRLVWFLGRGEVIGSWVGVRKSKELAPPAAPGT